MGLPPINRPLFVWMFHEPSLRLPQSPRAAAACQRSPPTRDAPMELLMLLVRCIHRKIQTLSCYIMLLSSQSTYLSFLAV